MKYIFTALFISVFLIAKGQIVYVNSNATGNNDGSSWVDAYTNLQDAVQATQSGDIWVAEGIYKCTEDSDREISFEVNTNVNLYGGFPSSQNPTMEDRDWEAFPTILSGDIGMEGDTSDNSYNIIDITSWDPFDNTIDGFTFTAANASYGAGAIDVSGLFDFDSKVTIQNCAFINNYAGYEAAAIGASWTDLVVDNCTFKENHAGYGGGAISYFSDHFPTDAISFVCKNSTFADNSAGYEAGAIDIVGSGSFYNCLFDNNFADYEAGAISHFSYGNVKSVNCTFVNNTTNGEGSVFDIFTWDDVSSIGAQFTNCIFNGNSGDGLITTGGQAKNVSVFYSMLENCPPDVSCDNHSIFADDPGFLEGGNYRLNTHSPCIDTGLNNALPADITTDLDGNARITNYVVDMGAYELEGRANEPIISEIAVYPNPVQDYLSVRTNGVPSAYYLVNVQGQILKHWTTTNLPAIYTIDMQQLNDGIYMLIMDTGEKRYQQKVVKVY